MKTIAFLIISGLICSSGILAQRLKGSDTLLPLAQKEAEVYMNDHSDKTVTVTGGGSGVGISSLVAGTTDIALASRKMKFSEKQKLADTGKSPKETIVAYDALAVVVNPSNKVTNLTREQLEDIFTGKIKNWKEVGGADLIIVPYARETSSGTYEFFRESVLKNKNYKSGIMSMPATGAIVQSVSQTPGAIGYVGFAYLNNSVKAIHVSYDQGNSYVEPSIANAKSKTYPIVRPLYFYYDSKGGDENQKFVDFVTSKRGQQIISEIGFIDINK